MTSADSGIFLVAPIAAIGNSLEYALAATAIAVVIGGLAAAALTLPSLGIARPGTSMTGRLVRGSTRC